MKQRCKALLAGLLLLPAAHPAAHAADQKPMPGWLNFFTHSGQWIGKPHIETFGVVQPTYTYIEDVAIKDAFNFTRARLGLRGTVTEDVSYFVLSEFANSPPTGPTNGGVRLLDGTINWRFSKVANVRAGSFIPDFAHAIVPGALVPWIDYTDVEKSVWFFNRQGDTELTAARETGVAVWNEFAWGNSVLSYELGTYNGTGLRQVETDDNKDVIASLRFATGPWHVKSGYWTGDRDVAGRTLGKQKWSLSGGWGNYVSGPYWILAEYLETDEDQPAGAASVTSDGFYVAAGWKATPKDLLVYRYSECDCVTNLGQPGKRDSKVHTVTYTRFLHGQVKIVAQYDFRSDDLDAVAGADSDAFRIMFSLPFSYRLIP